MAKDFIQAQKNKIEEEKNNLTSAFRVLHGKLNNTFEKDFMEAMQLPHMTDNFPHLAGVVPDHVLNQGPKGPVKPALEN